MPSLISYGYPRSVLIHFYPQAEDSQRAAHDKRLVKALLQKKLAHAFSSEEVGRLKQKGVYKEAEHDKLHAERLLITRQVRYDSCAFREVDFAWP